MCLFPVTLPWLRFLTKLVFVSSNTSVQWCSMGGRRICPRCKIPGGTLPCGPTFSPAQVSAPSKVSSLQSALRASLLWGCAGLDLCDLSQRQAKQTVASAPSEEQEATW